MNDLNTPSYTISNAAKLAGISVHTLRMYEKEGLIIPFKKESKQRLYSDSDIERLNCLRRLINKERIGIEGIRRLLALIPCWGIIQCSSKDRESCVAYNGSKKPCWMLKHKNNYCEDKSCRDCEVYQNFSNCESVKNKLKELIAARN